jgi:hypothetical protein
LTTFFLIAGWSTTGTAGPARTIDVGGSSISVRPTGTAGAETEDESSAISVHRGVTGVIVAGISALLVF